MDSYLEELVASKAVDLFADLLGLSPSEVVTRQGVLREGRWVPDLVVEAAGQVFLLEVAGAATAGLIFEKASRIAEFVEGRGIPLIVVPYMGEAGKAACARAGVSWLDLSGNAHLVAPGLRVIVEGRPNQFRKRGRPANVFAPKSSRVTRFLLMHPHEAWTQRQIALATGVSEGFVSRIVARLEADRYVARDDQGALRVKDPQLLLDAWREQYRFSKHALMQGHVAARSGIELSRLIANALEAGGISHAATGLAGAWQLTHFAAFRTATFYVGEVPGPAFMEKVGFREGKQGANLWLVLPNDAGVFQGASDRDGICCAHPLQVYLDLQEHPERAAEAAERLRADCLSW